MEFMNDVKIEASAIKRRIAYANTELSYLLKESNVDAAFYWAHSIREWLSLIEICADELNQLTGE